jgi:hypothetical protein
LYQSGKSEITWLDCETGLSTEYEIYSSGTVYPTFALSENTKHPAAVISTMYRDMKLTKYSILHFDIGKMIDIFALGEADIPGRANWIDESTIIVYGAVEGQNMTYYIDVSRLLTASEAELDAYAAEAYELFPKSYQSPAADTTPEPTPAATARPDYSGECKIVYKDRTINVEGYYSNNKLTEFFGEPLSDEITTKL